MDDALEIQPVSMPVEGRIRPPGSKSLTNRALVCAALAKGQSTLVGALDSEDTRVMIDSLRQLGLQADVDLKTKTICVGGCGGRLPVEQATLYVANSGTTMRFLAALVCLGQGTFTLDGSPRMRQRPIEDLLQALRQLGVDAQSKSGNGCPPVVIHSAGLAGGKASIRGDVSSQFLSGLLMAAPYARQDVELVVDGTLVSQPYVQMTLGVMSEFGVRTDFHDLARFVVPAGQRYQARTYEIEPDASAASYFWASAAITGGRVTIEGLSQNSRQGDVAFCDCLERMGCEVSDHGGGLTVTGQPLRGIEVDMNAISDTVQTLAAVALFASGPTTMTGVAHIRHKETDRIGDLARELRKLGADVEELSDGLRITPGPLKPAAIDTYNDHRMAMSLALVGLKVSGIVIRNPRCTEKTYPEYFVDLRRLTEG